MDDRLDPIPLSGSPEAAFALIFHNTHTFTGPLSASGTLLEVNRPALEAAVARLAKRVAERLRLSVPGAGPLEVTASVALADARTSAADLLARVDTAMYRSKGRGRAAGVEAE